MTAPAPVRAGEVALLALLVAGGLLLRLGDIDEPWTTRGWQQMNAFIALEARNWVEYGWRELSFAPTPDPAPPADGRWGFYMHHPPGAPLLVAASFVAFGVSEWAARLPGIVLSLLQLVATWGLARRLCGPRAALVAAAFGATVPASAFYGSFVDDIGPSLLGFVALACWLHVRHLERPSRATFVGQLLALACACLVNWQGGEVAGVLALHSLLQRRPRDAAWLFGLALAVPLLHLAHVRWAMGSLHAAGYGDSLLGSFLWRSWGGLDNFGGPGSGLLRLASRMAALYTWPVCALAALGCLRLRRTRHPWLLVGLLACSIVDMLIFLEGAVRHEYWCLTLGPALLVLAGAGALALAEAVARRLPSVTVPLLLVLLAAPPAAFGALRTVERFEQIEDTSARDLGLLIQAHSRPGELVLTCEVDLPSVVYYARRTVRGGLVDEIAESFERTPSATAGARFVLPERQFSPHAHVRMLALLREHFEETVTRLPDGSQVHVFNLSRRR
ncbi:MAG: hypothetical protein FJ296_11545 [Planctomycetes bacterium]|nr:hypothetical protein [Planctomycetota bacterium]